MFSSKATGQPCWIMVKMSRASRQVSARARSSCAGVNKFAQGESQWKEFHFDVTEMIGVEYPTSPRNRHADGESSGWRTCRQAGLEESVQGHPRKCLRPSRRVKQNSSSRVSSTMTGSWRITASTGTTTGGPWREYFAWSWRHCTRTPVHDLKQLISKVSGLGEKMGQDGGRTQGNTP